MDDWAYVSCGHIGMVKDPTAREDKEEVPPYEQNPGHAFINNISDMWPRLGAKAYTIIKSR